MQLEYLFKVRSHERFNQSCVIIHYSALSNDDSITIMFQDGVTLETQRIHLRNKDTIYKRKRKQKMNRIIHPLYDIQVKFRTDMNGKKIKRYGVTPLSTEGGVWESDYKKDIETIHNEFKLAKDYELIVGLSEVPEVIKKAASLKLDVLYIDGGHDERHIKNDIENYAHLVKQGGYMVIDDCCNSFKMPFGYFQGIDIVTNVVDRMLPPVTPSSEWQFVFSCVHNRVYKKL